jgi:hypothetical protein
VSMDREELQTGLYIWVRGHHTDLHLFLCLPVSVAHFYLTQGTSLVLHIPLGLCTCWSFCLKFSLSGIPRTSTHMFA